MFASLHSYINSLKPSLLHLSGQTNSPNGRSAKVKDGIFSETKFMKYLSLSIQLMVPYGDRGLRFLALLVAANAPLP